MSTLSAEGEALYDEIISETEGADEGLRKLFYQEDLQDLVASKGKTVIELMALVQDLVTAELLRTSKSGGRLCWSARTREAGKAIRGLSGEEKIVYGYIEDAQEKGIWVREIRKKSNLHNTVVDKAIRKIENSRLIKGVKNVKHPAQKTYLLFHLQPSDEITGGSFFDGGDLDSSLVKELGNVIIFHVQQNSWARGRVRPPPRALSPGPHDHDDIDGGEGDGDGERPRKIRRNDRSEAVPVMTNGKQRSSRHDEPEIAIVYPAKSRIYPTSESIHKFIVDTGVLRDKGTALSSVELQSVIDILVWDEKLERIGDGYRTVRGVSHRSSGDILGDIEDGDARVGNGLTQAPCWRCPVFDLCGDSGPVTAETCVYFQDWLEVAL